MCVAARFIALGEHGSSYLKCNESRSYALLSFSLGQRGPTSHICHQPARICNEETNDNSDYASDEMKDMVSSIQMCYAKKQSTIGSIRSCRKVERGNEAEQPPENVHNPKDPIIVTRISGEGCRDTEQTCDQVDDVVNEIGVENAENGLYSGAILGLRKEADNTEQSKDDPKYKCKNTVCRPRCSCLL
jgi:hypothetical protein